MAMLMKPGVYQHPALATQLTPPPSPGHTAVNTVKYTANTGKLRRERTPEPLTLAKSNYEPYLKKLAFDAEHAIKKDALFLIPSTKASTIAEGGISPLSTDFEVTDTTEVSRPASYFLAEPSPNAVPTPRSKYSIATPTIHEARFARQLPLSTFNSHSMSLKRSEPERPALPKLVTLSKRPPVQPPTSVKHDESIEKELPPPPPKKEISPQRTIVPSIDPDVFPMPEPSNKNKKSSSRILRTVQSIGILHSGPKTGDSMRMGGRPGTSRSNGVFHKRLFSGGMFGPPPTSVVTSPSTNSTPSIFSMDSTTTPRIGRRLSQLSRRRGSQIIEDPLAPVSIIPVMSNHEDVAGGLTYLPRYTNNFAGFCKSAWRLQLADTKSFDIKNRNSKTQMPILKCSKCTFEGPLHPQRIAGDRYIWTKIPDSRLYSSFGVSYTWQFLFKSHLALKKDNKTAKPPVETNQYSHPLAPPLPKPRTAEVDMADGLFGCILCCSKGLGVPVFKGPESLSWHLRSHAKDTIKDQEVIHRFKIIIGRDPDPDERFDVHIPQVDASDNNGASVSVAVNGDGKWEEAGKISEEYAYSPRQPLNRILGPTSVSTPMLDIGSDKLWEHYPSSTMHPDAITAVTSIEIRH